MTDSASIAEKLLEATSLVEEALSKAGYAERIMDTYELIEVGELGIALENLCENLYEFSCPIPQKAYQLFEETGKIMRIDDEYWLMLKPYVVG